MKPLSDTLQDLPVSAALSIDLRAKELIASGKDVISFCVGEPDFPTAAAVKQAGISAIAADHTKYTSAAGMPELRSAVSKALLRDCGLSYSPAEIAVTPGGKYAVHAALRVLCNPGDEVILPAPYWTSYIHSIRLAGAEPKVIPCRAEDGLKLTPDALLAAISPKTKAMILNNPNNPSGAVYTKAELEALSKVIAEKDLYVIADEIYSGLVYTANPFTAFASLNPAMRERTITVSGVSKSYAMTGWRIGYAAARQDIISAMTAFLSHTTGAPNTPAQLAAVCALDGSQDEVLRMREIYLRRRDRIVNELRLIPGLRFTVPDGAFYVIADVRPYYTSALPDDVAFALSLLSEAGVSTVPCEDYGAPGYLRLSFTLEETRLVEGIQRVKQFIERITRSNLETHPKKVER